MLEDPEGRALLAKYFRDHLAIASRARTGIVLETPTWRASSKWGAELGYDAAALDRVNPASVAFLEDLGREYVGNDLGVTLSRRRPPRPVVSGVDGDPRHARPLPVLLCHGDALAGKPTATALKCRGDQLSSRRRA